MVFRTVIILFGLFVKSEGLLAAAYCPSFRSGISLHAIDLVGTWLTVYTQPQSIDCFTLHIRATTPLERIDYKKTYGHLKPQVNWEKCLLEVQSPRGKHFLQGDGSEAGLLLNVVLILNDNGTYSYEEQSADQWTLFRQGDCDLVVMRDCEGNTTVAFARAPCWPAPELLYTVLRMSGVTTFAPARVLCESGDLSVFRHYTKRGLKRGLKNI